MANVSLLHREGWDWMLTSVPYGEQFRRHRAAMQKFLMPELVDKYQDMQTKEPHRMIVRLMDFERNKKAEGTWAFARHVKQYVIYLSNRCYLKTPSDGVLVL